MFPEAATTISQPIELRGLALRMPESAQCRVQIVRHRERTLGFSAIQRSDTPALW